MSRRRSPAYVLSLLTAIYTLNFVDRQILAVLLDPVREALGAGDTAMGLLIGPAFALFYTTLGFPLARLADRTGRRRDVIAAGLFLWSLATACTGLVTTWPLLVLCRLGVGLGEAACTPPAHSLLSALYPPARRTRALAVYSSGIYLGLLLGMALPGWLNAWVGWRGTFLVLGLPGLLLAPLLHTTVVEPPAAPAPRGARAALRRLAGDPVLLLLALGGGMASIAGYAHLSWDVTFLTRTHGLSRETAGTVVGLAQGLAGALGMLAGGWLADRLGGTHPAPRARVAQGGVLLSLPFLFLFLWSPAPETAVGAYAVAPLFQALYLAPLFGLVQWRAPATDRALAAAGLLFVMNLLGLGLGPPLVGLLSDLGAAGLALPLTAVTLSYLGAAACFGAAARRLGRPKGRS